MKLRTWPWHPANGCPLESIELETGMAAEAVLYDAGGIYRLMPRAVIVNALERQAQMKKAEHPKGLMPPVVLRFDQTISINFEVAKVLLEELNHDLSHNG